MACTCMRADPCDILLSKAVTVSLAFPGLRALRAQQQASACSAQGGRLDRRNFGYLVSRTAAVTLGTGLFVPESPAFAEEIPSVQRGIHSARVGTSFRDVAKITSNNPVKMPEDDEVLVKVVYAGINGGCETFRARGEGYYTYNKDKTDIGFGAEGTGVVVKAGPNAPFAVGANVAFLSDGQTFSEYVTVPASYCISVDKADAANCALRISGVTANNAINIKLQAQKDETILITGAAGGTGNFAVQLAKNNGCKVIATCGSEEKAQLLKKQGVDHVINYKKEDIGKALKRVAPNGLDCCLEGIGGKTLQAALDNLKPDGRLCILGYISQYAHNGDKIDTSTFDFDGMGLEEFFWKGKSTLRGDQVLLLVLVSPQFFMDSFPGLVPSFALVSALWSGRGRPEARDLLSSASLLFAHTH
jgi:NADPH:quinone reductase-like Zn-dependent oxidoreductase